MPIFAYSAPLTLIRSLWATALRVCFGGCGGSPREGMRRTSGFAAKRDASRFPAPEKIGGRGRARFPRRRIGDVRLQSTRREPLFRHPHPENGGTTDNRAVVEREGSRGFFLSRHKHLLVCSFRDLTLPRIVAFPALPALLTP